MFKTLIATAALALTTLAAQAAPTPLANPVATSAVQDAAPHEETAYFCQWVTVYDYYGNWVTVWRCF